MPSVKVYKMDGSVAGEMQLSDKIFNAEYNEPLIHQAVVTRLANDRQVRRAPLPARKCAAAAQNPGGRRVRAVPAKALSALRSGRRAASCSHRRAVTSPKR